MSQSGGFNFNQERKSPPAKNSITVDAVDAADNEQQIGQMANSGAAFLADSSEAILMSIPHENQLQNIPPLGSLNETMPGMMAHSLTSTPPLLGGTEVEKTITMMEAEDIDEGEYGEWTSTRQRQLSELKVHELKNECKKRQMAISGSKQQLIDRLRPFERQILAQSVNTNSSPPPIAQSSPPSLLLHQQLPICSSNSAAKATNGKAFVPSSSSSSSAVIDAVIDSVIDGSGLMKGFRKNGKCAGMKRSKGGNKLLEWKTGGFGQTPQPAVGSTATTLSVGGIGKCKRVGKFSTRRKQQQQNGGTLADLLRGGTLPSSANVAEFGQLDMFIGRNKGGVNNLGVNGCYGCAQKGSSKNVGDGKKQSPTKWSMAKRRSRLPAAAVDEEDGGGNDENQYTFGQSPHFTAAPPMPHSVAPPSSSSSSLPQQQFETMTFSFAQMGSGGQFTPMEPADMKMVDAPTIGSTTGEQNDGDGRSQSAENESNKKRIHQPRLAPLLLPNLAIAADKMSKNAAIHNDQKAEHQCNGKSSMHSPLQQFLTPQPYPKANPFINHYVGDRIEGGGEVVVNRRRHSTQIGELFNQQQQQEGGWAIGDDVAAELMSATTLARHEECLRQQQRKIHELQRELARSQLGLQQHQQMLSEVRTSTALTRDPETGRLIGQVEFWVDQLEAGYRQLECANREKNATMERQIAGHRALVCAEQKLQEELHTDQAVQDICRLIRQEPKAALLIVQLLRRYQLERSSSNCMVVASSPSSALPPQPIPPPNVVPHLMNGQQPALWNGFLSVPSVSGPPSNTTKSAEYPKHYRPQIIGGADEYTKGKKRCGGTLMKGSDDTKKHEKTIMATNVHHQPPPPIGRSNSVLDGMTKAKCAGGGGPNCCVGKDCATRCGHFDTTTRRPRSSLGGTTEVKARHYLANGSIDMEEIFRSVLQGDEADGGCRMAPESMESPQKQDSLDYNNHPPPPIHHHSIIPQPSPIIPFHSFMPMTIPSEAAFLVDPCSTQMFVESSNHHNHNEHQQQQEMEKTMQDLMEVLRDDQENSGSIGDTENNNNTSHGDCPSQNDADFQTDQLATFLAEEVELCRTATNGGAHSASAIFPAAAPAQSLAMAIHQPQQQNGGMVAENVVGKAAAADGLLVFGGGTASPAVIQSADCAGFIFACPPEKAAEKAMDWLDGFDPFTAVF